MSLDTRGGWFSDVRLDVAGAVVGLILAVAMVPLRFVVSQVYIETLPLVLGVACTLYLLAVRNEATVARAAVSTGVARLLPSVSVLGIAGMVLVATLSGRSVAFFAVSAVVGTLLFAQILLVADEDFHTGVLLFQIVIYGLVLRFAGLYSTPGYIGIDIWTHVPNWSRKILAAHSLSPIADEKYYASPLFHLLVVAGAELFNVSLRDATFLTSGLAMPLSVLLVYSAAKLFVPARWAVFATAVFALSGSVIEWGLALIPTSLGLVFFLAIFYAMLRILYTDYGATDFVMVVFFSVAVILTHQISAFIMLVFVGASLLAKLLLRFDFIKPDSSSAIYFSPQDTVNVTGLLVFDLGLITFMWSLTPFQGSSFLQTTFNFFYNTAVSSGGFLNLASSQSASAGGAAAAGPSTIASVVRYTDVLGFLLLLALTILGCLYLIRRQNVSHAGFTTILSVVVMLVFIFGFPLFGIRTFVPGRWFAFIAAPMAVLAAIGLGYLSREASAGTVLAVLLIFTLVFPAVSITTGDAALDNPVFGSVQTRYSYTDRELAAVDTIGAIAPANQEVHTDHPYGTVFQRTEAHDADVVTVVNGSSPNATVVHRSYQDSGAAYFVNGHDLPFRSKLTKAELCGGRDVPYDDGSVQLCQSPPSSSG